MIFDVYLDESGDLGWSFELPFRKGGSSRYLTLAYLIIPHQDRDSSKRLVRDIYRKYKISPSVELKASILTTKQKFEIAEAIVSWLNKNPGFQIGSITVKKEKVFTHIRSDGNKLYNYMMGLSLLPKVKGHEEVIIVRDDRTIKVASGNSCIDYLQIKMWFDYSSPTKLKDNPSASDKNLNLIFIDWVANFVWSHYEDGRSNPFYKLSTKINNQTLFF